ncbi:dephospho-CoA kinase [Defluviicoccus vanus]|uniref:dephospho-CoA kinase n=1 Tax=Defluviicoccus vanus TaxID=111831 RepID=UPI002952DF31|nr:dephospho-CoA kinase [Defluviicoccus vanus]
MGARVFADATLLHRLEQILHPLVREARERFLALERRRGTPLVVLDIPLLYETSSERTCDAVAVVSAPLFLQWQRLRHRPNFSEARVVAILARQLPDAQKRRRADFVIPSGLGKALTRQHIAHIVATLVRGGAGHCDALPVDRARRHQVSKSHA